MAEIADKSLALSDHVSNLYDKLKETLDLMQEGDKRIERLILFAQRLELRITKLEKKWEQSTNAESAADSTPLPMTSTVKSA